MAYDKAIQTKIHALGEARIDSPASKKLHATPATTFVRDVEGVLVDVTLSGFKTALQSGAPGPAFELAGPRK